jgi:hydrogenase maturation protease
MGADRVLGVGSQHGDDAAGWRVVEMLRRRPGLSAQLAVIEPPQLLDHLAGCRRLILVDACRAGRPPGTVIRLQWPDPLLRSQRHRSSHGLAVGDALALAEALGWLPPQVLLWGVEMASCQPAGDLSPEVARALPELERQILQELVCVTSEQNHE